MSSNIQGQETRRSNILDGINGGFAYSKIAAKLGVPLWVVMSDLKRMRHNRDPELKQAIRKGQELVQAKKQSVASLPDERFHRMTGMTFKEKTFSNMMSFYKPELMKILKRIRINPVFSFKPVSQAESSAEAHINHPQTRPKTRNHRPEPQEPPTTRPSSTQ